MTETTRISKGLNVTAWIAQGLLSLTFIWAAYMKLFSPADELAKMWPWTAGNTSLVKLTGLIDLLAGLGLVLPGILRLRPKLIVYAAYGTIALMVAASVFHILRGEASQIGFNVFVILLAIFIAWARTKK